MKTPYFTKLMQQKKERGFAMLFTVLLISLVLAIALGISDVTFKQTILSSLAKDSQAAFYQADAGTECGLYYDFTLSAFPAGTTVTDAQSNYPSLTCGNQTLNLDSGESATDYFVYRQASSNPANPCFNIVFDKRNTPSIIQAYGYNICDSNHPRQVERGLEVKY